MLKFSERRRWRRFAAVLVVNPRTYQSFIAEVLTGRISLTTDVRHVITLRVMNGDIGIGGRTYKGTIYHLKYTT